MLRFLFLLCAFFSSFLFAQTVYPLIIIGGGIGALTSALYLARAGIKPLIIEGPNPGGLLTQSHSVQNWPGELEIPGHILTEKMLNQVVVNGAEVFSGEVVAVDFSKKPFSIQALSMDGKKHSFLSDSCIVAMGTQPNYLGVPGESGSDGYWGKGVTNCAVCDGNLYKGKTVGVVGGGDAAVLEALYLSNIAKEVTVFIRKSKLRAQEKKRIEQLLSKPNIKLMYNTQVSKINGDKNGVTGVSLFVEGKKKEEYSLDGLFLAIGSTPNSQIFQGALELDSKGYIVIDKTLKTSIDGVYAVGDIVDPVYKQAITASGDGAKAALELQQFLSDKKAPSKKDEIPLESARGDVIEIQSVDQFREELKNRTRPLLIDFYAPWCGPCKKLSFHFEASANKHGGKVRFLKVNVDKLHTLGQEYNIRSLPTAIFFNTSGDIAEEKIGLGPIQDLLKKMDETL